VKKKVLHFAPEQEFYKRLKKQTNIDYTTTDLLSPLADVKADICNLPFEDNGYDLILCNHVLEHIPDDTKAMQELYRVLKPGGMGIFQIPQDLSRATTFADDTIVDQKERAKIFGQYDHVRVYGRDYFDKLRSIGFKVVEEDYTNKIAPETNRAWGKRLDMDEKQYDEWFVYTMNNLKTNHPDIVKDYYFHNGR
jgi:SAM-dependent methyltransferase